MSQYILYALIGMNVAVSLAGFSSETFFRRFLFHVDDILIRKQYYRMITSGFLHANWMHLIMNMLTLFLCGRWLGSVMTPVEFLVIYFGSMIGGDLLSLFIHRHHGDYSAIGASGAVSGIIFAMIATMPGKVILLFMFPIPTYIYGPLFVLVSIFGIRDSQSKIGHDAHLGGAIIGMLIAIGFHPASLAEHPLTILLTLIPAVLFMIWLIRRPEIAWLRKPFGGYDQNLTLEDRYNAERKTRQEEIDRILDKINRSGVESLTRKEKEILDEYAKK